MEISIHHGLREEINTLKKRIIELETAEADKSKLRKELANVKRKMNEEKSRMEMDFMDQVSAISQANALKVEEIETQLKESHSVNRALSEQLEKVTGLEKKMQMMEMQQEKEIARIVDSKIEEIDEVRHELDDVKHTKDELAVKLGDAQTRVEAERKKVQELNMSIEELNRSILNDSQAEKAALDAMEAQLLNAERENKRLKQELQAARTETKDPTENPEIVRALREKLRERDLELNSKTEEIRQLQASHNETKVQSLSIQDLQQTNTRLTSNLERAVADQREKEIVVSRLESDNRKLHSTVSSLRNERKELLANLQESMKHDSLNRMAESDDAFAKLQSDFRELKASQSKLVADNTELKESLRLETDKRLSSEATTRQRENNPGAGNRTSQIIKQLEENLKREGQTKHATTMAKKNKNVEEKANDVRIQTLKADLKSVKMQLDSERDITRTLRKELREVKDQRVRTRHSSSVISHGVKGNTMAIESRIAVKGFVETMKQRTGAEEMSHINSVPIQRHIVLAEQHTGLSGYVEELQEELKYEHQQVVELEEELTKQCEINCILLKEISNLSCESNVARKASSRASGSSNGESYGSDQKEIDRLIMEVAGLKSKLFSAEQSKASLEESHAATIERHQKEIEVFKEQLQHVEKTSKSISSRMDESTTLDRQEIDSLQRELNETKFELTRSKELLSGYGKKTSQQSEVQTAKMEALQAEMSNLERSRETLELAKQNLEAENLMFKTANENMEKKYAEQQSQFDVLQETVNDKVQQFEMLRCDQNEEIDRLREQVTSLEQELSQTLEKAEKLKVALKEKEDMESTVDDLARKNVQGLHAQINKLQKQLTMRQVEVSETESETKRKISALEEVVDATQLEMEERLREKDKMLEELKRAIDSKDGKALLLEKEKEQLVLSMNDMMKSRRDEIDDLQKELMEMSTRSANQTREVQTLKLQLQESGYRKDEMDRLRARVTELGDMLTGRKERRGSDLSVLEVENSNLRERLRAAVADCQVAEDKLRDYVTEKGGSKQLQILRERNSALKHEVEKLTRKMKKLTENFRVESPQNQDKSSGSKKTNKSLEQDPVAVEATRFVI